MLKLKSSRYAALAVVAMNVLVSSATAQEIVVKTGEKIAFLGDSITQQGAGSPVGYVRLVISGLEANGIKAEAIPAGISGHKSNDMLARVDKDVIEKKPNWMTLSCGVNDVWHGERGVTLDQYKANITQIVDKAQAAGIKVVILTSTMIGEDQPNANNQKLLPYNGFLEQLAKEKKLPLADLNGDMQATIKATPHKGNLLTGDGVHMNPMGNVMMANGVLKAFGMNDLQLRKANETWLDIPKAVQINSGASLTLRQFQQLSALAAKQNRSLNELVSEALNKAVESLLKQN